MILDILQPIRLLKGSHKSAAITGQGCVMNVVSYLNGDKTITDHPKCACPVITPIAIWLNDFLTDAERPRLLPYALRISGSKAGVEVMAKRAQMCAEFAHLAAQNAQRAAQNAQRAAQNAHLAAQWAAQRAAQNAHLAAQWAAQWAAQRAAQWAAQWAAQNAQRDALIEHVFRLLDDMLALTDPAAETPEMIERAQRFVEMAEAR